MPKISIIVPIYNTEKYLCKCLDSILSQSFTDYELLLIDDGSSDESGTICDKYATKDSRIRVFHKENGGVSSARNMGIDNAVGEWITFVDSDDELPQDSISTLCTHISTKYDLICGGYAAYNEVGSVIEIEETRICRDVELEEMLLQMFPPFCSRARGNLFAKLFRKSIISQCNIRFDSQIKIGEDRLFNFEYMMFIIKDILLDTSICYNYFLRSLGTMGTLQITHQFDKRTITDLVAFRKMENIAKQKQLSNDFIEKFYQSFVWYYKLYRSLLLSDKNKSNMYWFSLAIPTWRGLGTIRSLYFILGRIKRVCKRYASKFSFNYRSLL